MKTLQTQKRLASEILGVGKRRVKFETDRIDDIKEAITKEDIKELVKDNAITIKPLKKKPEKAEKPRERKSDRGVGRIRKRINHRKKRYVRLIRKLRKYLKSLKLTGIITNPEYRQLRKLAKAGRFWSKRYLKEYLKSIMKKKIEVKLAVQGEGKKEKKTVKKKQEKKEKTKGKESKKKTENKNIMEKK